MSARFDMRRKNKAAWDDIKRWPHFLRFALIDVMEMVINAARNHVYRVGFSGGPAHLTSRRHEAGLRGSVSIMLEKGTWPRLRGGLQSNLVYARIHEFGGTTRPHIIEPKRANVLAFGGLVAGSSRAGSQMSGTVFARRVRHPGSKIPARPYMRPALEYAARQMDPFVASAMRRRFKEAAV